MQFPFSPPPFLCVFVFNSGQEFYNILKGKDRNKKWHEFMKAWVYI